MTARLHLLLPALTTGARRGLVGADDGLDQQSRDAVRRRAHPWPDELEATCAPGPACVDTAALMGLHAEVDPHLVDWDLGIWRGRSLTEIATETPKDLELWSTDPDFAEHGGESLEELRSRVTNWLDKVETAGHPRQVTVAPAAIVRAILLSILDAPTATFWRLDLEPLTSVHVTLRPGRRAVRWPAD